MTALGHQTGSLISPTLRKRCCSGNRIVPHWPVGQTGHNAHGQAWGRWAAYRKSQHRSIQLDFIKLQMKQQSHGHDYIGSPGSVNSNIYTVWLWEVSCKEVGRSTTVPLFKSRLCYQFLLLLTHIWVEGGRGQATSSRWWFKYQSPCQSHGRPGLNTRLLASARYTPGIWELSQQTVLSLSLFLPDFQINKIISLMKIKLFPH